ncbi:MAG: M56 family metallopeptidase [Thermofilum sp.]|nr:M56 family metallopeptidase [Thermofilum sp.]
MGGEAVFFIPPACLKNPEKVFSLILNLLEEWGYLPIVQSRNLVIARKKSSCEEITAMFSEYKVSFFINSRVSPRAFLKEIYRRAFSHCETKPEIVFIFPVYGEKLAFKSFLSTRRGVYNRPIHSLPLMLMLLALMETFGGSPLLLSTCSILALFFSTCMLSLLLPRALKALRINSSSLLIVKAVVAGKQDLAEESYLLIKRELAKTVKKTINEERVRDVLLKWGIDPLSINTYSVSLDDLFIEERAKPAVYLIAAPNRASYSLSFPKPIIFVTTGIIAELSEDELRGIIMHEYAHIKNRDSLILPLIGLVGFSAGYMLYSLGSPAYVLGIYGASCYLLLSLLFKAVELRADVYAAKIAGRVSYARALLKLEYPKLVEKKSILKRIADALSITSYPPPLLRLRVVEQAYILRGCVCESLKFLLGWHLHRRASRPF